jgi:hypothetical protein
LIKEGSIKENDPLSKFMDLFGDKTDSKITVRQLIDMRSGLGDYLNVPGFEKKEEAGNLTIQDRLEAIKKQPLLFEPGKGMEYSNSGYVVLGAIIEKVTGRSYKENLEERIFKPLKLANTYVAKADIINKHQRAVGTQIDFKGEKMSVDDLRSDASPDGGIFTTIHDLMTFAIATQKGSLPSGTKYPFKPIAGGSDYWNTVLIPFADGTMIIVMSNMDMSADELGMRIYQTGTGKTPQPLRYPKEMQLYRDLKEKGIAHIETSIKKIVRDFDLEYDSRFLNYFGYRFLNGGDIDAALQLFELNTRLFPTVANTYDSLAEAWLKKGNKELAIKFYKKVLEVDANSKSVKEKLAELQKG